MANTYDTRLVNNPGEPIEFQLKNSGGTPVTGLGNAVTITFSKNGAAFVAGVGSVVEIGDGYYEYVAGAADFSGPGETVFRAVGASAVDYTQVFDIVTGLPPWQSSRGYCYPLPTTTPAADLTRGFSAKPSYQVGPPLSLTVLT
jgi:hypothetical protein